MEFGADSDGGGGLSLISAGFAHGRSRGGSEWVDGEAAQLGVRRIEAGRRAVFGATSSARSAQLVVHASSNEKERRLAGKLPGRPRGEERRRGAIADAWRRSPAATAAVRRRASTVDEQEKHSEAQ